RAGRRRDRPHRGHHQASHGEPEPRLAGARLAPARRPQVQGPRHPCGHHGRGPCRGGRGGPVSQQAGRIYVYSAPGYDTDWTRTSGSVTTTGRGRFKVGWTGRADARVRVREQTGTVYPDGDGIVIHLDEPAVRDDGTPFTDTDVLHVLDSAGVHRTSEVVEATLDEIRAAVAAVRTGHRFDPQRTQTFGMRAEQATAVERTAAYFTEHADDAKPPRF